MRPGLTGYAQVNGEYHTSADHQAEVRPRLHLQSLALARPEDPVRDREGHPHAARRVRHGAAPPWPPAAARRRRLLLALTAWSIPLSTSGMQIGVVALVVLALVACVAGRAVVRRTPLDGALRARSSATLALSTLASGEPFDAPRLGAPVDRDRLLRRLLVARDARHAAALRALARDRAACVVAVYGIVQHFTGIDWYRELLGRADGGRSRAARARTAMRRRLLPELPHLRARAALPARLRGVAGAARRCGCGWSRRRCWRLALVFSTARGAWIAALAMRRALRARPGAAGGDAARLLARRPSLAALASPSARPPRSRSCRHLTTSGDERRPRRHLPREPRDRARASRVRARLRPLPAGGAAVLRPPSGRPTAARTPTATSCRSPRRRGSSASPPSRSSSRRRCASASRRCAALPRCRACADRAAGAWLGDRRLPGRRAHPVHVRRQRGRAHDVGDARRAHALRVSR